MPHFQTLVKEIIIKCNLNMTSVNKKEETHIMITNHRDLIPDLNLTSKPQTVKGIPTQVLSNKDGFNSNAPASSSIDERNDNIS